MHSMVVAFLGVLSSFLLLLTAANADNNKGANSIVDIDPYGERTLAEASFALLELQKLSDSTIYDTLTLSRVVSAKEQVGLFHFNTILQVELASPYFRSGKQTESFEIIVMEHLEDKIKSFAIDEFPDMDENAIENFWIRKVELKKRQRDEAFRRLEIESVLLGEEPNFEKMETKAKLDENSVQDLLSVLDTPSLQEKRQTESLKFQKRLRNSALLEEERLLMNLSLEELFVVSQAVEVSEYSDFQKYRAKHMLDASMQELQLEMAESRK